MLRWFVIIWLMFGVIITGAAVLNVFGDFGWGYGTREIWAGLLMLVFGCGFWVFATVISRLVLGVSRRLYRPDPGGPMEG